MNGWELALLVLFIPIWLACAVVSFLALAIKIARGDL